MRGNIVDVRFPASLPPRNRALRTGHDDRVVLEVETHLSSQVDRCIGLTSTRGLSRGMAVRDTGDALHVPVGRALLGRMLDVFGEPIDRQGPIEADVHLPIHRPPLPLHQRVTRQEICVSRTASSKSSKHSPGLRHGSTTTRGPRSSEDVASVPC